MASTARRLRIATALLVVSSVVASAGALLGLREVHTVLHEIDDHSQRIGTAGAIAAAVRDQYAHQAHTLILGDQSHLGLYDEAYRHVLALLTTMEATTQGGEDAELLGKLREGSKRLDDLFRQRVLPALERGDREAMSREHARLLEIVQDIQGTADELIARHQRAISSFESHASVVEHSAIRWTIVLMCGAVLLAVIVTAFIGRAVAAPLARLEAFARRLGSGELSARFEAPGVDEFATLGRQMNEMASSLKAQQEKLVQTEKLAGIGRLAAGVAHEINNPIGVILGYSRILQRAARADQTEDLRIVEKEALRCREIVEGLLDLARPLKVGGDLVDLRAVAEEAVARVFALSDPLKVSVDIAGQASAEGHRDRLRQLILNLVKNGLEAAAPSGRVTLSLSESSTAAVVEVSDTGPGLSEEARSRLYEPFFTTKPTGTGLGLAISRSIAEAHHGELVVSNLPGGGASFRLTVPRRR